MTAPDNTHSTLHYPRPADQSQRAPHPPTNHSAPSPQRRQAGTPAAAAANQRPGAISPIIGLKGGAGACWRGRAGVEHVLVSKANGLDNPPFNVPLYRAEYL